MQHNSGCLMIQKGSCYGCDWQKCYTGKGNTIKVTMSYGEQSTLEELLIAYLGQEIAGGSAA